MGTPNPVRTLESHGVVENGEIQVQQDCSHYMRSIRTGAEKVVFVEQCATCLWIDPASLDWWAENAIKMALSQRAQRIAVAAETEPFAFVQQKGEDLTLFEVVFQSLGAASTCWVGGTGDRVFDSTRAKAIGDALLAEIDRVVRIDRQRAVSVEQANPAE